MIIKDPIQIPFQMRISRKRLWVYPIISLLGFGKICDIVICATDDCPQPKPQKVLLFNAVRATRHRSKRFIPVVALVDTNADPTLIDYVIPGNDDAIKGVSVILDYVAKAIEAGKGVTKKEKGEA